LRARSVQHLWERYVKVEKQQAILLRQLSHDFEADERALFRAPCISLWCELGRVEYNGLAGSYFYHTTKHRFCSISILRQADASRHPCTRDEAP
jgi:hypothetical protein